MEEGGGMGVWLHRCILYRVYGLGRMYPVLSILWMYSVVRMNPVVSILMYPGVRKNSIVRIIL